MTPQQKKENNRLSFFHYHSGWVKTVLVLALLMRLLHFQQMKFNNPIFDFPIVDSKEYVDDAHYYNNVSWLGDKGGSYFHPPFYSYFVGAVFFVFGEHPSIVKLIQVLLDVVNAGLLYLLAKHLFNRRIAMAALLIYAMYIRIIQYTVEILPPVLLIFLFLSATLSFLYFISSRKQGKANYLMLSVSGLSLSMLIVTLPNFLLTVPVYGLWMLTDRKPHFRKKIPHAAIFSCLALSLVACTALRNRIVAGETLLISRNGGISFYIGNNEKMTERIGYAPGIQWEKLLMYPYESEKVKDFAQQDKFFYGKAFEFIRLHPGEFVRNTWMKTVLFFNSYEFPRNFDVGLFASFSFVTRMPFIRLGFILPLALAGMALFLAHFRRMNEKSGILLLMVLLFVYAFSIILVLISARYRLPVLPFMIIFASYAISSLYDFYAEKKYVRLAVYGGFALFLSFLTGVKYFEGTYPYTVTPGHTYALFGNTLLNNGHPAEAKKMLEKGIAVFPSGDGAAELYFQLGHYYRTGHDSIKVEQYFRKAFEADSSNYQVLNSLGFEYKMAKRFPEAIYFLRKGIRIAPCFPETYLNLADCYLGRNLIDSAVIVLRSYNDHCPSPHPTIAGSLGKLYMDVLHQWDKALEEYLLCTEYPQGFEPGAEIYNRIGSCYFQLKKYHEARQAWMKGLEIDPGNQAIKINLDFMRQQGKTE